jgi:hypothetical protein
MQRRCIPFCCSYYINYLSGRNLEICPDRLVSCGSLRSHVVQDLRSSLLLGMVKPCQTAWNAHGHFSAFCTVCERFASFWGASLRVICPVGRRHIDYRAFPKMRTQRPKVCRYSAKNRCQNPGNGSRKRRDRTGKIAGRTRRGERKKEKG